MAPFSSHDVLTVFIQDCAQRHLKIILGGLVLVITDLGPGLYIMPPFCAIFISFIFVIWVTPDKMTVYASGCS